MGVLSQFPFLSWLKKEILSETTTLSLYCEVFNAEVNLLTLTWSELIDLIVNVHFGCY